MTLLCRFGWHRWSLWGEPYEGIKRGFVFVAATKQQRRCQDCRVVESREVR